MPNSGFRTPRPEDKSKEDSDAVPIEAVVATDPVQRATLKILGRLTRDVAAIKEQLAIGDTVLDEVKTLPVEFAVLKEQVETMQKLVYGAVALMLIGIMGTWGAAIIFFLKLPGTAGGHGG
jgi:hypothetical protein